MSSRFSLICFDLDGTLIDSRKDISDSINRMLRTLELPEKSESVIAAYVGNGMSNLIRQSLGEHHETLFDRALKIFRRDYDEHCVDVTTLYPGVREAMTKLTEKKVIVTNKPLHFTEKILKSLAIRDAFDRVMGGDMEFPKKPAPDVVFYLAKEFGSIAPEHILFVGDSLLDIHTGKNAGTKTCAVTFGFGKPSELKSAHPDYLIDSFEEILKIV